jgi:hypothetical protein
MWKAIGIGLASFLGVIVLMMPINILGMGISFAWLPFDKFAAQVKNTQDTLNITYNAQRCIDVNSQYQALKAQIPAIVGQQIPNAQTALTSFEAKLPTDETTWSPQQQQEDGELQTDLTGLEQQESQLEAQYTALVARPDTQPCLGTLPTFISLTKY